MRLIRASIISVVSLSLLAEACKRDSAPEGLPAFDFAADSTCEFIRAALHPDPSALVTEFVARDAQGQFLSANQWLDSATTCPGHTAGPDAFTVVVDSRSGESRVARDSATYTVIYRRLGRTAYGKGGTLTLIPEVRAETLDYVLYRTPYGWRVDHPDIPQRVRLDSARRLFPQSAGRMLDSLAALAEW